MYQIWTICVSCSFCKLWMCLPVSEFYTEYKLWIGAYTTKHEGKPSQKENVWTDVRALEQITHFLEYFNKSYIFLHPNILTLTCQSGNTLFFIKWVRPIVFYRYYLTFLLQYLFIHIYDYLTFRTVDVYYVLYRSRRQKRGRRGVGGADSGDRQQHDKSHGTSQHTKTAVNSVWTQTSSLNAHFFLSKFIPYYSSCFFNDI